MGYYVGGMKQCDLQETEGKTNRIGNIRNGIWTLDIKSLSIWSLQPLNGYYAISRRICDCDMTILFVVDIVVHHYVFQNNGNSKTHFIEIVIIELFALILFDINHKFGLENDKTWTKLFEPKKME